MSAAAGTGGAPDGAPLLFLDFETRSTLDLREVGLDNYSRHPMTEPWCLGYALDEEVVGLVPFNRNGSRLNPGITDETELILDHVRAGGTVVAHNAPFELAIWNNILVPRYGWPRLAPEQCVCTMAMCYAMSLPGALEDAAPAVGLPVKKDAVGHRLMLQMAAPRKIVPPNLLDDEPLIIWWDAPEKLERLYQYCKTDVEVERQLYRRLLRLTPAETALWRKDFEINQRGIYVDRAAAAAAVGVIRKEQDRLAQEIRTVTGGAVGFPSEVARIKKWVKSRGVEVEGLAKQDVVDLLVRQDLPPDVERVLEIRQSAGRTSVSKLEAMLTAGSADGRLRNMFQYHGANTGRWAARRVQLHNLVRPKLKQSAIEAVLERLPTPQGAPFIQLMHDSPVDAIADCMRGMLRAAPGNTLVAVDYANIEGRVLAWLAGAEEKLEVFRRYDRKEGPDVYLVAAARIYRCTPEAARPKRQIGKVAELALGYGGGVGSFQTMAKTYGVKVSDQDAEEIKLAWRAAHPEIAGVDYEGGYWQALEAASIAATHRPGKVFSAGAAGREVRFKMDGSFLWCRLPSGRVLCYPYPAVRRVETPWGDLKDALTYMTQLDSTQRKTAKTVDDPMNGGRWWRISTYGGSLAENVTQAVARDMLADAMMRTALPIVLHVHDELVAEVPAAEGSIALAALEATMLQIPGWAAGLPIAVEGWHGTRYRK